MKKLMIAAAIVCAAAMSQATQVTWGLQAGESISGIDAGTMYLVYSSAGMDWDALGTMQKFSEATIADIGGDNIIGTVAYGTGVNETTYVGTGTPITGLGGGSKDFQTIIISEDGMKISYLADSSATINNTQNNMDISDFGTAYTTVTAQAVPEPTSGLLLLLGVAGMALRRRRA